MNDKILKNNKMINAIQSIQKQFKKILDSEIKEYNKKSKKLKKLLGKKNLKIVLYYLEYRLKKSLKKEVSYRYLLSHLIPGYKLDYFNMQILGLLDINNNLNVKNIKIKKRKLKKKKAKKILKLYDKDILMYIFIQYIKKKYKIN